MSDSEVSIVSSICFTIGYALLVMFGFFVSASGLIQLYKKEKKEGKKK